MDSLAATVERVKSFAKSSRDFVSGVLHHQADPARHNPIEILKRLQREAFSDIMKLRDRQDRVERILSFSKSFSGSPFQKASTHVRGVFDAIGGVLLMGDVDKQHFDAVDKADIRLGMAMKFIFETVVREKDKLVAELVADQKGELHNSHTPTSQLSLAKVFYMANINDCYSAIAIPIGAQFKDLDAAANFHGTDDLSTFGPPLLSQFQGSALGLMVRKLNIVASLAQSISGSDSQFGIGPTSLSFNTFGKLMCQLHRGIKFSVLGLYQVPKSSHKISRLGAVFIPMDVLRQHRVQDMARSPAVPTEEPNSNQISSLKSIALMLDTELDEHTRIGAWMEMKNSKQMKFAVAMYCDCDDDIGWGVSARGMVGSPTNSAQFQVESYLKLNLGMGFCVLPGIAYVMNENTRTVALMFRSNWQF